MISKRKFLTGCTAVVIIFCIGWIVPTMVQASDGYIRRVAVAIIPWLWLPAAVLELEAPATTGKFFSAVRLK